MVSAAGLSQRVAHLSPSATLSISAVAKAMQAEGLDVCSLSAGEPDFETPEHIRAAAVRALEEGKTRYGPAAGIPALRQAVADKLQQENGLNFSRDQILISNGGKQTLFNLAMVLLDPGDEVILPVPYWVSYPEIVTLAGAKVVRVPTEEAQGFKLTAAQLRQALTPHTKVLILNSPANPTGAVYHRHELEALAEVILSVPDLYVICDEIYEKLVYGEAHHISLGSLSPEVFQRTILSSGFAKAYAMTGWRIGYLAGPKPIVDAAINLQSHSTSNVCTFAQYGALEALTSPLSAASIEKMRQEFSQRRDLMVQGIRALPGVTCPQPEGAFYVFFNIRQTGLSSVEFCQRLLKEQQVAAVPGVAFGADHCIRLSYATDRATIEKGLHRLHQFVCSL
ncbi:pyridoxal phosphate-dependent aminotransferase [Thermostichus vulcanus]|uniref:Aminotransferase n=1 Tax=Thermostichus vulcanus str. 'Rupite' TaxID=2813851 RepID=A0ABT0CE10_THEVL|nr:pyridoxal phosphate-dependent aminotransferase [Thermostichus vulcanus]MCJ2544029.1 pyridoxal phosphate-dependent aminotransferase [Thermostichus vulcanus str. 'Rupite']